jgi:hypothetical protein
MTAHPALPRLAVLVLLAGCGHDAPAATRGSCPACAGDAEPEPEPSEPRAHRPKRRRALAMRSTSGAHRCRGRARFGRWWGHGCHTRRRGRQQRPGTRATGGEPASARGAHRPGRRHARTDPRCRRPQQQDGLGQLRPGATGKPVIYLHVPSGAPPVDVTLSLALSATSLLEHWPPRDGHRRRAHLERARREWPLRIARGRADHPRTPRAASVRDGFCEAAEIPRYHGDDDTCLTVGGQETPLLFYRGEGTDGSTMPLALRPRAAPAGGSEVERRPGLGSRAARPTSGSMASSCWSCARTGSPASTCCAGPTTLMPGPDDAMAPTLPEDRTRDVARRGRAPWAHGSGSRRVRGRLGAGLLRRAHAAGARRRGSRARRARRGGPCPLVLRPGGGGGRRVAADLSPAAHRAASRVPGALRGRRVARGSRARGSTGRPRAPHGSGGRRRRADARHAPPRLGPPTASAWARPRCRGRSTPPSFAAWWRATRRRSCTATSSC